MSQFIAPGQWDAISRRAAKAVSVVVGILLVVWSSRQIGDLIEAAKAGVEINVWSVALVMVPLLIGGSAALPGVVTPLIYRGIEAVRGKQK